MINGLTNKLKSTGQEALRGFVGFTIADGIK